MSESGKDYELKVLKTMLNKYLEEITSITEESLRKLEIGCDQFVWDLATKIYRQSGHKVDLSIVRDVVNSRTKVIKYQIAAEEDQLRAQVGSALVELGGDTTKVQVFIKVRKIISEQLSVNEDEVSLSSHLSNELGAYDSLDFMELVIAIEEEFKIEISDSEAEDELGIQYYTSSSGRGFSSGGFLDCVKLGDNCIVRSFVDLIHKKIYG